MRDILADYDRLATAGRQVGRAVVTSVPAGPAPRRLLDAGHRRRNDGGLGLGRLRRRRHRLRDRRGDRARNAEAGDVRREPRARVGGRTRLRWHDPGVRGAARAAGDPVGRAGAGWRSRGDGRREAGRRRHASHPGERAAGRRALDSGLPRARYATPRCRPSRGRPARPSRSSPAPVPPASFSKCFRGSRG